MRRLLVMAIGLGTIACGSDKPTEPSGHDLAGEWTGPVSSPDPANASGVVSLYVALDRSGRFPTVQMTYTSGAIGLPRPDAVDLEPTFFDLQFNPNGNGGVSSIHCVVATSTAKSCDGTLAFTSGTRVSTYPIHLTR